MSHTLEAVDVQAVALTQHAVAWKTSAQQQRRNEEHVSAAACLQILVGDYEVDDACIGRDHAFGGVPVASLSLQACRFQVCLNSLGERINLHKPMCSNLGNIMSEACMTQYSTSVCNAC